MSRTSPATRIGIRTLLRVGPRIASTALSALIGLAAALLAAQTIRGTLMEVGSDRPVPTADLFLLLAECG